MILTSEARILAWDVVGYVQSENDWISVKSVVRAANFQEAVEKFAALIGEKPLRIHHVNLVN